MVNKQRLLFLARNRGIAVPADLESQIQALFTRSQLVMKHTRQWLSHGKVRRDSMMNLSRDYRSIIEGLQVRFTNEHLIHSKENALCSGWGTAKSELQFKLNEKSVIKESYNHLLLW